MIYNGEQDVTLAGTREPLMSARTPASWVIIQSKSANTNYVYVGGNAVDSTNGLSLIAEDSVTFPSVGSTTPYDLALIYVDAAVDGEGVKFTYFQL